MLVGLLDDEFRTRVKAVQVQVQSSSNAKVQIGPTTLSDDEGVKEEVD